MTELDALLSEVGRRGFMWHLFRADRYGPEVLAGVFQHSGCADVVVLTDVECAHAYRLATGVDTDVFAPVRVSWWYVASPVWTLRALLTLAEPTDRHRPDPLVAPSGFGVPGDRVPVSLRRRPHTKQGATS
ncbi:hypothetical protein BLA60_30790 [Actinophytocola xinjiangensis]|uniref:Uncharacterized protein n=1 Tax=Actinophytocola xinjiangensis TaxID=485602 RepID=A0A7Z0WGG0_9PSEU|nr:hypothetical protein [Actinophytocola xinjiangensis]OLF06655.1 hypothetical protein BLA60_30790 [Actinophytocola xinjiangensis]